MLNELAFHRSSAPREPEVASVLDVVATLAMIGAAGIVMWNEFATSGAPAASPTSIPVPGEPVSLDGAPILGSPEARVTMLVFSDFECPFCARFANEVLPTLRQQYVDPGKVKLAFRHLPLTMHSHAERAAESAECAARQGRFWAMHDSLFQAPVRLDEPDLEAHAREVGLDLAAFATCMGGEESRAAVSADAGAARGLGVTATPAILIGIATADASIRVLEVIPGVRPVDEFSTALDRALADKGSRGSRVVRLLGS